jgi:hypothetical protein
MRSHCDRPLAKLGFSNRCKKITVKAMDSAIAKQLQGVAEGSIRDEDSARRILAESREALEIQDERLGRMKDLLFRAEQAFLRGWPATS